MRCSLSTPTKVSLLTVLAGLTTLGCADDSGPTVYVDVSLAPGIAAPAKVELRVLQAQTQTPLVAKTFAWPASGLLKAGVALPKGAAGNVAVSAIGLDATGGTVASGLSKEGAISSTFAVVLDVVVSVGADAGTDGPGPDRVPMDQVVVVDPLGSDTSLPSDGRLADIASDVTLGPDGSGPDGPGIGGDVLGRDVSVDGPFGPEADLRPVDTGIDIGVPTRAWATPAQLDPDTSGTPSLALDPATGNAVVAWADSAMGVMAASYKAATNAWATAVNVASDADIGEAKAAVDAKGHYVLVWTKNGPMTPTAGTWASFSPDGTTWSKPTQLFDGGEDGVGSDLRIAMNRSGQAMVTWDQYQAPEPSGQKHQLYAVYLEGTANKAAVLVSSGKRVYSYSASVAIDGNGNGIIAWDDVVDTVDADYPPDAIWAATFAKQTVATPAAIQVVPDDSIGFSLVAMNEAGQGIVVWRKSISTSSGSAYEFYGLRYSATGSWSSNADLVARASKVGDRTALVLDSYGVANLAWSRANGPGWQCNVSTQSFGGTWSTQALETDNLAVSYYYSLMDPQPALALDGNGNLLAGWRKKVSDTDFVPTFRWRLGNTWGPVLQTGQIADLFSWEMTIAATDDGRAAAAWTYDHCDPTWTASPDMCPTAKPLANISLASHAAYRRVSANVYR
jgi:hypothetical protein